MITTDSRVDSSFGRYELNALLGKGAMGEVYKAYDSEKRRTVALKILRPQYANDERFRARFLRESHAAAILQEPHVIPIHDWGEIDGQLFIDMRLVQGHTLYELICRGPLEPDRAVTIIDQIAAALDAAHAEGLIHRDVKPQNIIVTPADFAYLVDFGIVETQGDARLTMEGTQIGSLAYMAPERFSDVPSTPSSDTYSLTCVLYEALTGDTPFRADSFEHLIAAHLSAPPPAPSVVSSQVPAPLDDVIARGMAKEPDDRYGSAGALGRAARRALQSSGGSITAAAAETMAAPVTVPLSRGPEGGVAKRPTIPTHLANGSHDRERHLPLAIIGITAAMVLAGLGVIIGILAFNDSGQNQTPTSTLASRPSYTATAPTTIYQTVPGPTFTKTATQPTLLPPPTQRPVEAAGIVVGTCDEGGSCGVKQRTGPYTDAPRLYPNDLKDGAAVTAVCQTTGDVRMSEGYGSSYIWYRLYNGAYVNSVYLNIRPVGMPAC